MKVAGNWEKSDLTVAAQPPAVVKEVHVHSVVGGAVGLQSVSVSGCRLGVHLMRLRVYVQKKGELREPSWCTCFFIQLVLLEAANSMLLTRFQEFS